MSSNCSWILYNISLNFDAVFYSLVGHHDGKVLIVCKIRSETAQMFVLMFQKSRLILVVNLTLIPDMKYKTNYIAISNWAWGLTYVLNLFLWFTKVALWTCVIWIMFHPAIYHLVLVLHNSTVWQYVLWSFQTGYIKLERFLPKNQHTQRKFLNFENWTNGEPQ